MSEDVKISALELENVKRVRALMLEPTKDGLTVIGGRNAQGKTSVLDAIAWALGGNKMRPANPNRDGAAMPAKLKVSLSNGLVVERKGKNGALHVTDEKGMRAGQALLDEFVGQLALDLPRFLNASDRERADYLLATLGVDAELARIDRDIKAAYDQRRDARRDADRAAKAAEAMPWHEDAPEVPVSVSDLTADLQAALATNAANGSARGEVELLRARRDEMNRRANAIDAEIGELEGRLEEERLRYKQAIEERDNMMEALLEAKRHADALEDVDTAPIERAIAGAEADNEKWRDNQRKAEAEAGAKAMDEEADRLSERLDALRGERMALLERAGMPLPELSIEDGALTYRGQVWSDMSGAEQLRVATAIVRATKPECGFVLVDKLEQLDHEQLAEFAAWCEGEGLQVIGTRVATDDTCTVVIEDGRIVGQDMEETPAPDPRGEAIPAWGGGEF